MVDINKRNAIKAIGGTAAIASMPSLAVASAGLLGENSNKHSATQSVVVPLNTGTELSISMSLEGVPSLTLTNHSNQLIVVRHVHPGIVHAGTRTFDLNAIFSTGAHSIDAGSSRTFNIEPTSSTQAQIDFPRHLYRNKPQRVVTVRGADHIGEVIHSSRSFYS